MTFQLLPLLACERKASEKSPWIYIVVTIRKIVHTYLCRCFSELIVIVIVIIWIKAEPVHPLNDKLSQKVMCTKPKSVYVFV